MFFPCYRLSSGCFQGLHLLPPAYCPSRCLCVETSFKSSVTWACLALIPLLPVLSHLRKIWFLIHMAPPQGLPPLTSVPKQDKHKPPKRQPATPSPPQPHSFTPKFFTHASTVLATLHPSSGAQRLGFRWVTSPEKPTWPCP